MDEEDKKLGRKLIDAGLLDDRQLRVALAEQKRWGNSLGRVLLDMRMVDEKLLIKILGEHLSVKYVDLENTELDETALKQLDEEFCRRHECIPFDMEEQGRFIAVAMTEPNDGELFDQIQFKTQRSVRPYLAGPRMISEALDRAFRAFARTTDTGLQFAMLDEKTLSAQDEEPEEEEPEPAAPVDGVTSSKFILTPDRRPAPSMRQAAPTSIQQFMERTDRVLRYLVSHLMMQGILPYAPYELFSDQLPDAQTGQQTRPWAARAPGPAAVISPHQTPAVARPAPAPVAEPVVEPELPPVAPDPEQPTPVAPAAEAPEPQPVPEAQPVPAAEAAQPQQAPQAEPSQHVDSGLIVISLPETEDSEEESIIQVEPTSYVADASPAQQAAPTAAPQAPPSPAQQAPPTQAKKAPTPAKKADKAQQASATASIAQQPSVGGKDPAIKLLSAPELAGETVVAIDFGTTRSSVAVMVEGEVSVLRLPGGDWDIPSVVGFRKNGSVMVGSTARRMLATDPANAIASPKRMVGRRYEDRGLQPYLAQQAITSLAGPSGEVMLFARGREISATEACAHLLNLLRLISTKHLGKDVKEVLLTTPVSFGQPQFKGLTEAAELAGLKVLRFVDEPVAASLANRAHPAFDGRVAVYDFGGGTFDFTVVEVSDDVKEMQVLTTAGDAWVGGDDLDEALATAAANAFWQQHGIELRHQVVQWQRLLVVAEMAKRELSSATETTVRLPKAARTPQGELDLVYPVTRAEFSALIKEPIQRTLETCREALALCDLKPRDLNAVFLSSGTCYIPAVQEAVADFFGKEPVAVVPPERAVLLGAAVYGGILAAS